MTTEKMTVHKALCELKTLDSRIQKAIGESVFVFANKHSNNKVSGMGIGEYSAEIKAKYQSVCDLLARRDAIKRYVGVYTHRNDWEPTGLRYLIMSLNKRYKYELIV